MDTELQHLDEVRRARQVAEAARDSTWEGHGFLRDLFLGRFRFELIDPYPLDEPNHERQQFRQFYDRLAAFLREHVDPNVIDELGEYPTAVIDGLRKLGAFGIKIPVEYGGLGFNQVEYGRIMKLLGSHDANLTALLSAHQSIGVPQPVKLFGSELLKRKYLPRCAAGAISAFALTETDVGSDPARLTTTAEPSADGESFILNGDKLWCTNGTLAEVLVVMARNPQTHAISAFVVETAWPGVEVLRRCHFMGLHALANAVLRFTNVKIPRENLIGAEGKGLKIALTTLNTGRLSLPAAVAGGAKTGLEVARKWASARVQWGQPIGKHEVMAHKLADMAATAFAMEALSDLAQGLADRDGYDIRIEAAAAKEWNTMQSWRLIDEVVQIRGGRGYEKASSLAARGEMPIGCERWMRDARINTIFEGSSEIMHLFMAREAVDKHLQIAGVLISPEASIWQKLRALPGIITYYAVWFASLVFGWSSWPRYRQFGSLAGHLRFIERSSRRLAREVFYSMLVFRARAERKQAFLFRLVDIANELLVMAASISRATALRRLEPSQAQQAWDLVDHLCRLHRRKVASLFHALWHNDDDRAYRVGRHVLDGTYAWIEAGGLGLGYSIADLVPKGVSQTSAANDAPLQRQASGASSYD
jgi:alkylation response protein AidB-like acyl-CoA dehydrogenase